MLGLSDALIPTDTLLLVAVVALGLQLLGVDVLGMALDFVGSLLPSWQDLTGWV